MFISFSLVPFLHYQRRHFLSERPSKIITLFSNGSSMTKSNPFRQKIQKTIAANRKSSLAAMTLTLSKLFGFGVIFSLLFSQSFSCTFTIINNCPGTIWPGTLAGAGFTPLPTTGFQLDSGRSVRIPVPVGWSGRVWARTGCVFDETGLGTCQTGDCDGKIQCDGSSTTPPATLFEITFGKGEDEDYYDISIVDGYNLPLIVTPDGVCNATGCTADLNSDCPKELQVVGGVKGGVIACKSACDAFGRDEYCCSGEYASPASCKPSFYSTIFKRACPTAYTYAFDDVTSTFTCKTTGYTLTFCPGH